MLPLISKTKPTDKRGILARHVRDPLFRTVLKKAKILSLKTEHEAVGRVGHGHWNEDQRRVGVEPRVRLELPLLVGDTLGGRPAGTESNQNGNKSRTNERTAGYARPHGGTP